MSQLQSGSDFGAAALVDVTEASQVGQARRTAAALARRLGFDETEAGKVALAVTEAATNLVKHGGGGEVVLRGLEHGGECGIEMLALDRGPGMADLSRCLRDGFSTAGSPGTGLGAIARLSGLFDAYTRPQAGTTLLARLWARPAAVQTGDLEVGALHLPKPGEAVCGDAWAVDEQGDRGLLLVADGLGHGPDAAAAAREAVRVFRDCVTSDPAEIVRRAHAALRGTRGAALAVAELNFVARVVRYVGVGNIAGTVFAEGASRSLVSHNGTVGHEVRKVQAFEYPFPEGALLVMHSDGLATHWRLEKYPALAGRHPGLIAGVLYRDFKRGRDDVTVLAVRRKGAS